MFVLAPGAVFLPNQWFESNASVSREVKSPTGRLATHEALWPKICYNDVRCEFYWSLIVRAINCHLPDDDPAGGFTRYTKSQSLDRGFQWRVSQFSGVSVWQRPTEQSNEAVGRGFQWYITVATSNRAIKRFEMTDPWLFKESPVLRSRGRSRGIFCLEPGPPEHFMLSGGHSRSWNIFSGAGVKVTPNFASLASIPGMRIWSRSPSNVLEVESKSPGHLIRAQSPIRSEYFHGLQNLSPSRNYPKFLI